MEVTKKEMKEWVEAAHGFARFYYYGAPFAARWLKTKSAIRALIEKYAPEETSALDKKCKQKKEEK